MTTNPRVSRLTEWWQPKAGAIISLLLFYLALWSVPFATGWKLLAFSIWTLTGFGVIGYFLNDWADIPFDEKAGKTNLVKGIPVLLRWFFLIGLLLFTAAPWIFYFEVDFLSLGLIGIQIFIQFAYPVPPLRLKRFPIVAMFADASYAFVVPSLLAWHTFDITANEYGNTGNAHFAFLAFWMLFTGLRHIIAHHVADRENDRLTETPNLALSIHPKFLRRLTQVVIGPLEFVSAILFFIVLFRESGMLPLVFIGALIPLGSTLLMANSLGFQIGFWQSKLDRFTSFYFGLISLFFLIFEESSYLIILAAFVLLFTGLVSHPLTALSLKKLGRRVVFYMMYPVRLASLAFNWSLYYFRKWFLNWDEKRNWGVHYEKHLKDLELEAKKKRGVVAVFNQNNNKYTETFVNGHLTNLPFQVIPFYGWPSPTMMVGYGDLISDSEFLQSAKRSVWQLLNADSLVKEDRKIAAKLIEENVDLILVEFGTMGARLLEVSRMTGIPMIVIFYGYDAWHQPTVDANKDNYNRLFSESASIVGVSKDICTRLEELGCPKEKLVYLPCFVDLEQFEFTADGRNEDIVLTVGRFCVTKGPELTILAFNEVLKHRPNAQLRMIGDDDGNGVLESCRSLVRALGIEQSVHFLGSKSSFEVALEMKKATVFTQHSVTAPETNDKEGTPVAIMEAMATGLPVVATKHAGIAEMIVHESTGILINEFDYIRQAEEMVKLFSDSQKRTRLGKEAANSIRWNKLVANHIEELTRIIDKHKA